MNLYVQFRIGMTGFLNIAPANPNDTFYYYRLEDGNYYATKHDSSFNSYLNGVISSKSVAFYSFTSASTPEELYSLNPEFFI